LEAGAVPTLLPGGSAVADADARAEWESAWGLEQGSLPAAAGRDTSAIMAAAAGGELDALVVGGVDPDDLPDPDLARKALDTAGFVLSLEMRHSAVTEHADVVLPIAPVAEKAGSYRNWEGRERPFAAAIEGTGALPDCRVLDTLAVEMDADLFTQTPQAALADFTRVGSVRRGDTRTVALGTSHVRNAASMTPETPHNGHIVLATWHQMIDNGSLQVDEPHLAGTARPAMVLLSAATAEHHGIEPGGQATVRTDRGSITLPAEVADLPEGVVWVPARSPVSVRAALGVGHGGTVSISPGAGAMQATGGEQ
ncbi:MAG: molybdopterin dinucleotide binding domain-containing protein, partial [Pseudonocardiaceae bacterium]